MNTAKSPPLSAQMSVIIGWVPFPLWHNMPITKWILHALCIHRTWMFHCWTTKGDWIHIIVNILISMYGDTNVTPAVHGCHGNFIFYQWLHFDYETIRETEYYEVWSPSKFVWLDSRDVIYVGSPQVSHVQKLIIAFVPFSCDHFTRKFLCAFK